MDGKNRLSGFKPIKKVGLHYGTGENEIPFLDFPRYKKEQNNNNKNKSSVTKENNIIQLHHFLSKAFYATLTELGVMRCHFHTFN